MKLMVNKNCTTSSLLIDYVRNEDIPDVDIMDAEKYFYVTNYLLEFEAIPCLILNDETCIHDVPTIKKTMDEYKKSRR